SNYFNRLDDSRPVKPSWNYVDLAVVIGTSVALIVFFYSGTFFHWNGIKGLYQAYLPWFKTGSEGHGHEKPWYYWLSLISHYELPVLAGLLLCIFALRFKAMSLRYLAIYGVGTLIAYSIVKYKTPWCIISFIWPFLFTSVALITVKRLRFKRVIYLWLGLVLFALLAFAFIYAENSKFDDNWPYTMILGTGLLLAVLLSTDI